MAGIPKKRIQQLLEAVSEVLGATFTAELPTEDLSRLLWLTTRAKPSTRVVYFRAKTYKDLCTKFRRSSERVRRSLGEDGWTALINDIVQFEPGKDHFRILAHKSGFDEGWLQVSRKRKGSNELGDAPLDPGQQLLAVVKKPFSLNSPGKSAEVEPVQNQLTPAFASTQSAMWQQILDGQQVISIRTLSEATRSALQHQSPQKQQLASPCQQQQQ